MYLLISDEKNVPVSYMGASAFLHICFYVIAGMLALKLLEVKPHIIQKPIEVEFLAPIHKAKIKAEVLPNFQGDKNLPLSPAAPQSGPQSQSAGKEKSTVKSSEIVKVSVPKAKEKSKAPKGVNKSKPTQLKASHVVPSENESEDFSHLKLDGKLWNESNEEQSPDLDLKNAEKSTNAALESLNANLDSGDVEKEIEQADGKINAKTKERGKKILTALSEDTVKVGEEAEKSLNHLKEQSRNEADRQLADLRNASRAKDEAHLKEIQSQEAKMKDAQLKEAQLRAAAFRKAQAEKDLATKNSNLGGSQGTGDNSREDSRGGQGSQKNSAANDSEEVNGTTFGSGVGRNASEDKRYGNSNGNGTSASKGTGNGNSISNGVNSGAEGGVPSGAQVKALSEFRQRPGNRIPEYQLVDRQNKRQGNVVYYAFINSSGRPIQFVKIKSTHYESLDQNTLSVLKTWRFYPGQEGWVELPFEWSLKGGAVEAPSLLRR